MKVLPLITIVTPVFNGERYLREAIESVLRQDYPCVEYLVEDGGSTDDTLDILDGYGDAISWISEPDRGQSHALNKGFSRAQGEFVGWLNADDVLYPGALRRAADALIADEDAGLVYGSSETIDEASMVMTTSIAPPPNLWNLAHVCCMICQPASLFRTSAITAVGGVDESLRWTMDYDLFCRVGARSPILQVDEVLAALRVHPSTATMTGGVARYREAISVVRRASHRLIPPASVHFLFELIENEVRLRSTRPKLISAVSDWTRSAAAAFDRSVSSVYDDGWVRADAHLLLPRRTGDRLAVAGVVPGEFLEPGRPQRLRLEVDGEVCSELVLESGPFATEIRLPPRRAAHRPSVLRVRASESFRPHDVGFPRDRRQLGWRYPHVRWIPPERTGAGVT